MINKELTKCIKLAQNGDLEAFRMLVTHFQDRSVAYAASILRDFDLAHDAAQEAFLEVYHTLPSLHSPNAFSSWFRKIIFKQCDRMMRGKQVQTVPLENAIHTASLVAVPEKIAELKQFQDDIHRAIQTLPVGEQEVLLLFYMGDHSYREIAEFLVLPVSTVKSRLHTGRNRLKGKMIEMIEENLYGYRPSKNEEFSGRVLTFTQGFSQRIEDGQSIVRSLLELAEGQTDMGLRDILTHIRLSVEKGAALSDAFAAYPEIFSEVYVKAITQGEQGDLRSVLRQLAQ